MVIFSGELTEAAYEKELADLRKLLQEQTAGIAFEDAWGRRELTYKIRRQMRAYYAIFMFNASPQGLSELRTSIKLNQNVLRSLLIALPENYEPGRYKEAFMPHERREKEEEKRAAAKREAPKAERHTGASLPTKEEEQKLGAVEKKLEEILENPDIAI